MDKRRSLTTIIALVFLGFVAYTRYSLPLDTALFNPESFYRGNMETSVVDPKEYYMKLHGLTFTGNDDDKCDITIKSYNGTVTIGDKGNFLFVPSNGEDNNTNFTSLIGADGSGLFSDGKEIILPVNNSKFKNSNIMDSTMSNKSNGRHDIELIVGDRILLVFEDVKTWWCHVHNPSLTTTHNDKVGYNSSIPAIDRGGAVIGISNSSTLIKVYNIKDSYYKHGEYTIEDVENIEELQQIHAGEYLVNGNIESI